MIIVPRPASPSSMRDWAPDSHGSSRRETCDERTSWPPRLEALAHVLGPAVDLGPNLGSTYKPDKCHNLQQIDGSAR